MTESIEISKSKSRWLHLLGNFFFASLVWLATVIASVVAIVQFAFPEPPICLEYHLQKAELRARIVFVDGEILALENRLSSYSSRRAALNEALVRRARVQALMLHAEQMDRIATIFEVSENTLKQVYGEDVFVNAVRSEVLSDGRLLKDVWQETLLRNGVPLSPTERKLILFNWSALSSEARIFDAPIKDAFLGLSHNPNSISSLVYSFRDRANHYIDEVNSGEYNDLWDDAFGLLALEKVVDSYLVNRDGIDTLAASAESSLLTSSRDRASLVQNLASVEEIFNELSCKVPST